MILYLLPPKGDAAARHSAAVEISSWRAHA
jgi:hypothetical protein